MPILCTTTKPFLSLEKQHGKKRLTYSLFHFSEPDSNLINYSTRRVQLQTAVLLLVSINLKAVRTRVRLHTHVTRTISRWNPCGLRLESLRVDAKPAHRNAENGPFPAKRRLQATLSYMTYSCSYY